MTDDKTLLVEHSGERDEDFQIYQLYSLTRVMFLFITHAIGPLAIICVFKRDCANTYKVIVVVLSGIFLKCFNLIETSRVSQSVGRPDQTYNECIDFNPLSTLVTALTGLLIILSVFETSYGNPKRRSYQHLALLYICSVGVVTAYSYARSGIEMLQFPIFETERDIFYLSICLFNPMENPRPMIMEYGLLIIPFAVVVIVCLHKRRSGK